MTPLSSFRSSGLGGAARARRCLLIGYVPARTPSRDRAGTDAHTPAARPGHWPASVSLPLLLPFSFPLNIDFRFKLSTVTGVSRRSAPSLDEERPTLDRTPTRTLVPSFNDGPRLPLRPGGDVSSGNVGQCFRFFYLLRVCVKPPNFRPTLPACSGTGRRESTNTFTMGAS